MCCVHEEYMNEPQILDNAADSGRSELKGE